MKRFALPISLIALMLAGLLYVAEAYAQATLTINFSAADVTAAQPWCQNYLVLSTTPTNAQLKQCAIFVLTRAVQPYSVATQAAAVTAVPFAPN